MSKRNKDKDQYIKFIAVIDIIMKYSDEKHHMTINDIKEKLYELENDFQIDFGQLKNILLFIMSIMKIISLNLIKKAEIYISILSIAV